MPRHKSAIKRVRTSQKARTRNMAARSRLRTAIKRVHAAGTKSEAEEALTKAIPVIDKTAQKGIIHKNQAARRKSSLTKAVNALE